MAANMVFNLMLIFPLQHVGLALATSLSAYLNAWLLLRGLRATEVYRPRSAWPKLLAQVGLAATAMGILVVWLMPPLAAWLDASRLTRVAWLAGLIGFGAVTYFAALMLSGWRPRQLQDHGQGASSC